MRKNPTVAEKLLWIALRDKSLGYKFRRQHGIENYIVDFYCSPLKLIIEVDGEIHEREDIKSQDNERTAFLTSLGYIIFRVTNDEILQDLDSVLSRIRLVIANSSPDKGRLGGVN